MYFFKENAYRFIYCGVILICYNIWVSEDKSILQNKQPKTLSGHHNINCVNVT